MDKMDLCNTESTSICKKIQKSIWRNKGSKLNNLARIRKCHTFDQMYFIINSLIRKNHKIPNVLIKILCLYFLNNSLNDPKMP